MKITPVTTTTQTRIYNKKTTIFQAKQMTLQKAETLLPEFQNISFWNKLKLRFTDLKTNIIQEILNQDKCMKTYNITPTDRVEIFQNLARFTDFDSYKKALFSLTQGEVPKINAKTFITQRLSASTVANKFVQERFDLFNNLYNLCTQDTEFDVMYLHSIVANIFRGRNVDKDKADFALKWIAQKGAYDISNSINYHSDADELYEHGLAEMTSVLKRINGGYFPSDTQVSTFKYLYLRLPKDAESEKLYSIVRKKGNPSENLLNFIVENFEDSNLDVYLSLGLTKDKSDIDERSIKNLKLLVNSGMTDWTTLYAVLEEMEKYKDSDEPWELLIELNNKTKINNAGYKTSIVQTVTDNEGKVDRIAFEKLLRVYEAALNNKETLRVGNEELTDEDIDEVFFYYPKKTLNTLDLLGEKTFVHSFINKIDEVEYYIDLFGDIELKNLEPLLKVVNPTRSFEYQLLDLGIKNFKTKLKNISVEEREDCINKINTLTKRRNEIMKNSIHDPKEALDLAIIYAGLYSTSPSLVAKIIPYMNPKTEEEKQNFYNILNGFVLDSMEIEKKVSQKVLDKIDFSKSRYLPQIFNSDSDFSEAFEGLLEILEKEPEKSNLNIFNSLVQNKETRKMFQKLGVNYRKWTTFNPDSNIQISVNLIAENAEQTVIRNLEEDLNGHLFSGLPINQREKITEKLKEHGFVFKTVRRPVFDNAGYVKETIFVQKLFKDGVMIDVKGAKQIISLIKEEMNSNEFWTRTFPDDRVQSVKATFKEHILNLRYNEVKNILDTKSDKNINITVQKADMNDIRHALFLGNDAGCCTAVDACNGYSAVTYIINKFISAIEIKDGDKFVGNTMCYLAKVDGELALVLDNIEMKSKYQYNDKIRDAIFAYAEKLCTEIGKPDLPIYLGPNRHKVNLYNYELADRKAQIIGSSGTDKIYFDFDAVGYQITGKDVYAVQMYKIR